MQQNGEPYDWDDGCVTMYTVSLATYRMLSYVYILFAASSRCFICRLLPVLCAATFCCRAADRSNPLQWTALADDWPVSWRPYGGCQRHRGPAECLLLRRSRRRHLQDHQQRADLGADF